MKGRRPRRDELDLWKTVARSVSPLPTRTAQPAPPPKKAPLSLKRDEPPTRAASRIGGSKPPPRDDLAPTLEQRLAAQVPRMDHKTRQKLRRGKLRPGGRIDLHGMTLDRAQGELTQFIFSAQRSGKRLVLVITGKGRPSDQDGPIPLRRGVLRQQVPIWLTQPPLASLVLQIEPAHRSHGGSGAYYVYLRRQR